MVLDVQAAELPGPLAHMLNDSVRDAIQAGWTLIDALVPFDPALLRRFRRRGLTEHKMAAEVDVKAQGPSYESGSSSAAVANPAVPGQPTDAADASQQGKGLKKKGKKRGARKSIGCTTTCQAPTKGQSKEQETLTDEAVTARKA